MSDLVSTELSFSQLCLQTETTDSLVQLSSLLPIHKRVHHNSSDVKTRPARLSVLGMFSVSL